MISKQVSTNKVARLARDLRSEVYLNLQNNQSIYGSKIVFTKSELTYVVFHEEHVYEIINARHFFGGAPYGLRYLKEEYLRENKFYGTKLESMFHQGGMQKSTEMDIQSKVIITKKRRT